MTEQQAWEKRKEEAKEAGTSNSVGNWRAAFTPSAQFLRCWKAWLVVGLGEVKRCAPNRQWTLNWDAIEDNILVGSCPRSASDVVRLRIK